jgi:hypothetical protein
MYNVIVKWFDSQMERFNNINDKQLNILKRQLTEGLILEIKLV